MSDDDTQYYSSQNTLGRTILRAENKQTEAGNVEKGAQEKIAETDKDTTVTEEDTD